MFDHVIRDFRVFNQPTQMRQDYILYLARKPVLSQHYYILMYYEY